jgi:hypothetical protein
MAENPTTRGGELFFPAADGPFFEWYPTISDDADLICAELSRLAYAPPPRIETELRRIGFEQLATLESRRLFSVRAAADGFVRSLGSADADMVMLGAFGSTAGERAVAHYARLFAEAGLRLASAAPTRSQYSIIRAVLDDAPEGA